MVLLLSTQFPHRSFRQRLYCLFINRCLFLDYAEHDAETEYNETVRHEAILINISKIKKKRELKYAEKVGCRSL